MSATDPGGDVDEITCDLHIHSKFLVLIADFWNVCLGGRNELSVRASEVRGLMRWSISETARSSDY